MEDNFEKPDISKKTGKPKRKLTEKQLEALSRGRAKVAEKKRIKKLNEVKEQEIKIKKKEQKSLSKNIKKEQEILEKLMKKKKDERKIQEVEEIVDKWAFVREQTLGKCETEEQFLKLTEIFDTLDYVHFENGTYLEKLKSYL